MNPAYDILELVPHSGTMSLLDAAVNCDEDSLTAQVTLHADSLFATPQGIPAWIGIEYMAQAIAAFAGMKAKNAGEQIRIGFLVGSRKYTCNASHFPLGSTLTVHVIQELQADNGLGVFVCRITCDVNDNNVNSRDASDGDMTNNILAEASLNVFQPNDVDEFLQSA